MPPPDYRAIELSPMQSAIVATMARNSYVWTRWSPLNPDSDHNHCQLCSACICNHRELYPHEKEQHTTRGCSRHAYRSIELPHTWLCRNCYKRVRRLASA